MEFTDSNGFVLPFRFEKIRLPLELKASVDLFAYKVNRAPCLQSIQVKEFSEKRFKLLASQVRWQLSQRNEFLLKDCSLLSGYAVLAFFVTPRRSWQYYQERGVVQFRNLEANAGDELVEVLNGGAGDPTCLVLTIEDASPHNLDDEFAKSFSSSL